MSKDMRTKIIIPAGLVLLLALFVGLPSALGYPDSGGMSADSRPGGQTRQDNVAVFAVIGDYGSGLAQEGQVAELIDGWNVDFVITTGDNYYALAGGGGGNGLDQLDNSVGATYCAYLRDAGQPDSGAVDCPAAEQSTTQNRFFPSIGNHERTDLSNGLDDYLNYFTLPGAGLTSSSGEERYYDFIQGPVHFFALDSDSALQSAAEMRAQQAWLKEALANSTAPWQVVYFHHAAYSSSRHGSREAMQWPFAEMGVDVVFQGHDHTYERIHQDEIVYIVDGFGGKTLYDFGEPIEGSQVRYNDNYGAVKVTATEGNLEIEAWALGSGAARNGANASAIVDAFTIEKEPTAVSFHHGLRAGADRTAVFRGVGVLFLGMLFFIFSLAWRSKG